MKEAGESERGRGREKERVLKYRTSESVRRGSRRRMGKERERSKENKGRKREARKRR